jgi:biotin carboxyl carrier protein
VSDDRASADGASEADGGRLGLDSLAEEVLPVLIARLRSSRLGELEVGGPGWRVRLRQAPALHARPSDHLSSGTTSEPDGPPDGGVARSPAVGYFQPADALHIGAIVQAGDTLGGVDVLGVVQDVNAPVDGIVSRILAESGQAVEYGQPLADIDSLAELTGEPEADAGGPR